MLPPFVRLLLDLFPSTLRGATGLLAWLATYAIHSTVLLASAWCVAASPLGRRWRLAESPELWRFALVGGVMSATCLTLFAPVSGTWHLLSAMAARADYQVVMRSESGSFFSGVPPLTTRVTLHPLWPVIVAALWALIVAAGIGVIVVAHRRLGRLFAFREPERSSIARNALREVQRRARVPRAIALRVIPDLETPVAIGRRLIGLPQRAIEEFDLPQLESVLAHELAHLEGRDSTWLLLARLIEAVFFFQPLNRFARRRMVEASEFAADRWAVKVTAQPITLARCLAQVAGWATSGPHMLAPTMIERRSSVFVGRVRRLTIAAPEPASSRGARLTIMLAMSGLVLLAPRAAIGRVQGSGGVSARRVMVLTDEATLDRSVGVITRDSGIVLLRVPDR
jgi:bla regulator protein blaR1